jgi:PKD repeat protein
VTITVSSPANQPPVANAGEDQTLIDSDRNGSEEVTLDGSGSSDPDGSIVSFVWNEGATQIATGIKPTVTLSTGAHTITLTVTDNGGLTDTDTVTITISSPANQPPVANAGPDQTVTDSDRNGSEQITLDGSGSSDPDGTIVSFVWTKSATQITTGVKPIVTLSTGTHIITLTVTDNGSLTDTDTVTITVSSPTNQPPLANAGPDQNVTDSDRNGSEQVTLDGSASSDPDGSIVSFVWREGGAQIATGVKPTVTLSTGTHTITLTVTDNGGLTDTDTVTIKVLKEGEEFGRLPTGCYNNVINPLKGEEAIIVVEIKEQGYIKIVLYDAKGNKIREVADEEEEADIHRYSWNGKDDSGNVVGSGVYFVHIQAGDYKATKKIVVIK